MTLGDKMKTPGGFTSGFDYLRIILSVGILIYHSIPLSSGPDHAENLGAVSLVVLTVLPMFFALSGFLVTGSLRRSKLHHFVLLRVIRIVPALAVEIALSALIIGSVVTTLPLGQYLSSPVLHAYFLNIIGSIHFYLPGVFADNTFPDLMNGQLWTIPFEFECYFCLVVLTILRVIRRRDLFVGAVVLMCLLFTARILLVHRGLGWGGHVPGRALDMSFLAAVALHLYRDSVPYSNSLGLSSLVVGVALLSVPETCYFAPFPIAYATVWLGLMRPPPVPFGDLSYGVFLFHFPVEQTIMHVLPEIHSWWLLTALALPITTVFAWFSWTLIEHPILKRKKQLLAAVDWFLGKLSGSFRRGGKIQPET